MKHIVNKYIERFDDEQAKEHTHHELILENCVIIGKLDILEISE